MKHVDDLFRDGLGGRKGDVPAGMWDKIQAAKTAVPAEELLDRTFADALGEREAAVPAGMYERIIAARQAAVWQRGWRYAGAAVLLLLLIGLGTWLLQPEDVEAPARPAATVAMAEAEVRQPEERALATPPAEVRAEERSEPVPPASETVLPSPAGEIGATNESPTPPPISAAPVQPESTSLPPTRDVAQPVAELPAATGATVVNSRSAPAEPLPNFTDRNFRVRSVKDGAFRRAPRHRSQTEMLFGAAYANQLLSVNGDGAQDLLSARENSEFPELSYQVTLRQAYRLTDRVTLRAGLTYLDIRNQFDYEEVVDNQLELVRRNNHIRVLEVPVLAGLTIPGKRLRVSLNAGPVFNLVSAAQGNYLDPNSAELRDLRTDGEFKNYTGVGYMTSLTTTYAIGKRDPFVLVLEPFFKHYPGSFTRAGAPLRERYWLAGLQLGVRKGL